MQRIFQNRGRALPARHAFQGCRAAVLVFLIGMGWDIAICQAQQPDSDVQGAQVLTRGPVHEAFAGIVTFNPEPGIVVTKAPPDLIEEVRHHPSGADKRPSPHSISLNTESLLAGADAPANNGSKTKTKRKNICYTQLRQS